MSRYFRYWPYIAVLVSVLGFMLPVQYVRATSCECFQMVGGQSYSPDVNGCRKNYSLEQCNAEQDRYDRASLSYKYECKAYRDDNCQTLVGSGYDVNSVFNKCWTQTMCDNAGGEFDASKQNSPDCLGNTARCFVKTPDINLQVPIPGLGSVVHGGFPGYMAAFYKFFIAALAICAVVMITWGGFKRIMAAGSSERIKDANDAILSAVIGLVIALLSYTLLNLVNPKLVNSTLALDMVKSQFFGDQCPDPDPETGTIYECGYKASSQGIACTGNHCDYSQGDCYKIDNVGTFDAKGKSNDYECLQPQQACQRMSLKLLRKINGSDKNDYSTECAQFDNQTVGDDFGYCAFEGDNGCKWYLPTGTASNSLPELCKDFNSCEDLNNNTDVLANITVQAWQALTGNNPFSKRILTNETQGLCSRSLCSILPGKESMKCKVVRYDTRIIGLSIGWINVCEDAK